MPFVSSDVEAPEGPHLGLRKNLEGGVTAIPVGAVMYLIMDPKRHDGVTPMLLVKVSLKNLVFRCACGNPKCTRVMKYKLEPSGFHPRRE